MSDELSARRERRENERALEGEQMGAPVDMDDDTMTQEEREAAAEHDGGGSEPGDDEGNGNGRKTLEQLAGEQPPVGESPETEEPDEPEMQLFGTESKVTGSVKGKRPDVSAVKLGSGAVTVRGQFHADDVLELRVLATLKKIEFVYIRDANGTIKTTKRVHHGTPTSIEQVTVPQEIQRARMEYAARELEVEPEALISALEQAAAHVGAE